MASVLSLCRWMYCGIAWSESPSFTFNATIMKWNVEIDRPNVISLEIKLNGCPPFCLLTRENILVLDIFFEALNYEKIEQTKAYEIAGLLGKFLAVSAWLWQKSVVDLSISTHSGPPPYFLQCAGTPAALRFPLWTCETGWTHFHNLMLWQGQPGWVCREAGAGWTLLTVLHRLRGEILN